ncbi:TPA: hypothetical protein L1K77_004836 [Escherichia coli]|nr:hypothetical protein [Escherichia coli]MBN6313602.1 hypothetical protein [Escherichia coli]HBB6352279.1 hypothetical protein [Escherichia coli]HBM9809081.1 hypothetical protein [Escherichia coli]HCO1483557.1 hypothetical protein [Escherichia coli]
MKATFNCRLNGRISQCRSWCPQITVASTWSLTQVLDYQLISRLKKWKNPLDGGFKLCDEVTTLNSITNFLRT